MRTAFRALVRKDIALFFADPRALIMSFAAPIAIASFFGFALGGAGNRDNASRIPVLITDLDGSSISREIVSGLTAEKALEVEPSTADEAREAVRKAKAMVGVVIPKDFGADAGRAFFREAAKPEINLLYDPSHAAERSMVTGILTGEVMRAIGKQLFPGADAVNIPFTSRGEAVTARRGIQYNGYAHAFAGMGVQFILFLGIDIGIGLLLQRQRGLWKRFRAAPLSRGMLLGSRALSAAILSFAVLLVQFLFARVAFGVRVEGSMAGFLGVAAAFALMTAAFGLLIAALGKTPDATRGLAIFATLLLVMFGGAWIPMFLFPAWLQKVTLVMPTRWAIDGIEAMTWRGLGFTSAIAPIAVQLLFAAVFGTLAVMRFRWEEG